MSQSIFISYGAPDEAFAQRLNDDLKKNGITTFFFKDNAVPGQPLHRVMRDGINDHDRVLLVCSKASLTRSGVLNEIEESLRREARDGGAHYLIPVRLDDYIFSPDLVSEWEKHGKKHVALAIRDRVVADFRKTKNDATKFDAALAKLVAALK
jgi:hypothetical protein